MKERAISSLKDLPEWFDLKKYARANTFKWSDWHFELEIRLKLRNEFREHQSLEKSMLFWLPGKWEEIKQHALLSLIEYEEDRGSSPLRISPERNEEEPLSLMSITVLNNFLAYGFYKFNFSRDKIDENFNLGIFNKGPVNKKVRAAFKWLWEPCAKHPLGGWMPTNIITDDIQPTPYIKVDLNASDEQIMKDFTVWLQHQRQSKKHAVPKKNFSPADFASWHEFSVLPYMDLMLWAEMENIKIQQHVIAQAIYPDVYSLGSDFDPLGKLKTTKKKAQYLLTPEAFNVLDMQADN